MFQFILNYTKFLYHEIIKEMVYQESNFFINVIRMSSCHTSWV